MGVMGGSAGSTLTPASGGAPGSGGAPAEGTSAPAGTSSESTGQDVALSGNREIAMAGGSDAGGSAGVLDGADPRFLIFLLLGQSNMVGQQQPESQDLQQDPRIKVLAYDNCPNVNRTYDEWYTAYPPLHQCDAGVGPGDYFAKTLIQSLPEGYSIGLVPLAVNGAPMDVFRKGVPRPGWTLPPDNHWATGYEWIMSRAQQAQEVGVIRGILFHQGESNSEQPDWVDNVKGLVTDLRSDLGIGDVPFLAGELYYDGCCGAHNQLVTELAGSVTNAFSISASGLSGFDQFHFDLRAQRELGARYAAAMQAALILP